MKLLPVILCGGIGARLFPLSRSNYPKPLLTLFGDKSLLQLTLLRINDQQYFLAPIIICNKDYYTEVVQQCTNIGITPQHIIIESTMCGTMMAIALAAIFANEQGLEHDLLILPSDHFIADNAAFTAAMANSMQSKRHGIDDKIIMFGIIPQCVNSGFGYIKMGESIDDDIFKVANFIEKPSVEVAQSLVQSKKYLWNSGIYLLPARRVLRDLEKYEAELIDKAHYAMSNSKRDDVQRLLWLPDIDFAKNLSIDKAIIEKINDAIVVKVDFSWHDVGTWNSLRQISVKDINNNVIIGDNIVLDSQNCYIHSPQKRVVALGLQDINIVITPDVIMISHISHDQHCMQHLFMNNFT